MVRKITAILLLIIILTSLFIVVFSSLAYAKGVSPAWHCWEIGVQIVCKNGYAMRKKHGSAVG
jgi:hypothetical protein